MVGHVLSDSTSEGCRHKELLGLSPTQQLAHTTTGLEPRFVNCKAGVFSLKSLLQSLNQYTVLWNPMYVTPDDNYLITIKYLIY